MSDETTQPTAPTAAPKKKMSELLDMVTLVAQGADKEHRLPDAEGYDATTAPGEAVRWCASILRIFIMRVIENILDLRHAVIDQQKKTADLPAMRAEQKEMRDLMKEIVGAIKKAQAAAGGQPAEPVEDHQGEGQPGEAPMDGGGDGNGNGNGEAPRTAEQIAAEQHNAELSAAAAELARGGRPDLSKIIPLHQPPATPVSQQTPGQKPVA